MDSPFDPRLQRPLIRISLGIGLGLILGPLILCVLVRLPSNEWAGPYSEYVAADTLLFGAIIGVPCGLLVGPMVALFARGLQLWWRGGRNQVPGPDPRWATAFGADVADKGPAIRSDQATDDRISRRTEISELLGEGDEDSQTYRE
jgi:hypothetical protein